MVVEGAQPVEGKSDGRPSGNGGVLDACEWKGNEVVYGSVAVASWALGKIQWYGGLVTAAMMASPSASSGAVTSGARRRFHSPPSASTSRLPQVLTRSLFHCHF